MNKFPSFHASTLYFHITVRLREAVIFLRIWKWEQPSKSLLPLSTREGNAGEWASAEKLRSVQFAAILIAGQREKWSHIALGGNDMKTTFPFYRQKSHQLGHQLVSAPESEWAQQSAGLRRAVRSKRMRERCNQTNQWNMAKFSNSNCRFRQSF